MKKVPYSGTFFIFALMMRKQTFTFLILVVSVVLSLQSCGDPQSGNGDNTLVLQKTTLDSLNRMIQDDPQKPKDDSETRMNELERND